LSSSADRYINTLLRTADSEVQSTLVSKDDLTRAYSPEITMRKLSEIKALAQKIAKILDTKQEGKMTFDTIEIAIRRSSSDEMGNSLVGKLKEWQADLKTKRKTVGTFERGEFYLMRKKWDELVKKIESALTKHRYAKEIKRLALN
jgi:predicted nuclease with TOPRIM domain